MKLWAAEEEAHTKQLEPFFLFMGGYIVLDSGTSARYFDPSL